MKYTDEYRLPLYEYKDGADLVRGYNKTAQFVDMAVAKLHREICEVCGTAGINDILSGHGHPEIDCNSHAGQVYVNLDDNSLWVCNDDYTGQLAWIVIADGSRPSRWFVGSGAPTDGDYIKNDMYLDSSNADVWMYVRSHADNMTVDASSYPIKLISNGKVIACNWLYAQGTTHIDIEADEEASFNACPSAGVEPETKKLPTAAYVAPFKVAGTISASSGDGSANPVEYDLYFKLHSQSFDSGKHFEHRNASETEYFSEAEVAITKPSPYTDCVFTVFAETPWKANLDVTTYGLYQAKDYALMFDNGVKWFDASGNIEFNGPWIKVANLAILVSGRLPSGGKTDQYLKKASDKDYDAKWSDIESSEVLYTNNSKSNTGQALDALFDITNDLSSRRQFNIKSRLVSTSPTDINDKNSWSVEASVMPVMDNANADPIDASFDIYVGDTHYANMTLKNGHVYQYDVTKLIDDGVHEVTLKCQFTYGNHGYTMFESVHLPEDVASDNEFNAYMGF